MALKIRLRQQGRTNRQTYRLVVTDIRHPRDGKYLEMVGWYNPFSNDNNCHVHADRIHYWVGQGAQITPNAEALIAKVAPHVIKEIRAKRQEKRVKKAAKRRALKKAKSSPSAVKEAPAKAAKPKKEAAAEKEPKAAAKPKAPRAKKAQAEA
jgi:small subunit ribosomal protein S16